MVKDEVFLLKALSNVDVRRTKGPLNIGRWAEKIGIIFHWFSHFEDIAENKGK